MTNSLLLILNDVFDSFDLEKVDDQLRNQFFDILGSIEKNVRVNAPTLGAETITNATYYFCKF